MEQQYSRLVKSAAWAATLTAAVLIVVKLIAWFTTDAASILAALTDSMLDISGSLINLLAIRFAMTPADENHRFGHGKVESLAVLAQSAFISGSAVLLVIHGISSLISPQPLSHLGAGMGVMLFSVVATLILVSFQRYVIKRTGSLMIKADSLHYQTDLFLNFGVLLALALSYFGWLWADGLFTLLLGGYILYGALKIGYDAAQSLMDRELPEEEQKRILELTSGIEGVYGVHDLRTRQAGPTRFIQFHLELDDSQPLLEAHALADRVEQRVLEEFPGADVIVHMDPLSVVPKELRNQGHWGSRA
ncbi:cation diffusion facilitator family transporter [Dongshaea marina]|uniref:cation diffusion facilitator family transporter n=1 Tax=Dongshaea marina TaxID=2047966 RepID=UPI000D3E1025|nr:cation diffusion facilitator family transporter [Dongshaea marina]